MITIETSSWTENASLEMHELIDGAIHLLGAGQHVVDTESGDIALILDSAVEGIVTFDPDPCGSAPAMVSATQGVPILRDLCQRPIL